MSIESVMPSNHFILWCMVLLLPPIPPSIRVFSSGSALHSRWPNIGASALASVLSMNIQGWFPSGLTTLISLQSNIWPPAVKSWPTGKDPDAGRDWGQEENHTSEDEMVGWHHWLNRHEFEQTLGDSEGQWSLACCGSWCCKESDTT